MYQETIQKINDYMKQSGKKQKQVAKESGLSPAVVSQFLSGTYSGNNQSVADTLEKYLELVESKRFNLQHVFFNPELANTTGVLFACTYARKYNDIALVCGDAGAGKTTALNYYRDNNIGVVMVTANSCISSASAILKLIARECARNLTGRKETLISGLIDYFKDSEKLLIIDEADSLCFSALQAIRALNDQAGIGIVLSGNDKIYNQMIIGNRSSEFKQLKTRVGTVKKVVNVYTLPEFRKIFPELDEECLRYLLLLAKNESLRTSIKLLNLAYDFGPVSIDTLQMVRHQLTEGL